MSIFWTICQSVLLCSIYVRIVVYTSAVTRDAGRVTRNQLRESGDQVQGMWTSYPAYGYIAKGIRYTASANGDVGAGDLE